MLQWHKNVLCMYSDKNWKMFFSFFFYKKDWEQFKKILFTYMGYLDQTFLDEWSS